MTSDGAEMPARTLWRKGSVEIVARPLSNNNIVIIVAFLCVDRSYDCALLGTSKYSTNTNNKGEGSVRIESNHDRIESKIGLVESNLKEAEGKEETDPQPAADVCMTSVTIQRKSSVRVGTMYVDYSRPLSFTLFYYAY